MTSQVAIRSAGAVAPLSLQRTDWVASAVLLAPLIGVTLLSKIAVPPFGERGLAAAIPLVLAALAVGVVSGRLRPCPQRFALYLILIGLLGLAQIVRPVYFSPTSLLLLAALHLPYAFIISSSKGRALPVVPFFLGLSTFLALCGIAQYALQFVLPAAFAFPIENFLPSSLVVQLYNQQGALEYGSEIYRSNGVFLLEPSFFSQVMGIAIVMELCTTNRLSRLAIFGLALLFSYSGTGVLVLMLCVPAILVVQRRWNILVLGVLATLLLVAFGEYLHLDRLTQRATEFTATGSSGFARFIGGFYFLEQYLWDDPWRTLIGFGAGSFKLYDIHAYYPVADMALTKIVFEYGVLGAVAYFGFLFYCLLSSPLPRMVVVALAFTYLLSGIFTPFAHGLALTLVVWSAMSKTSVRTASIGKPVASTSLYKLDHPVVSR